MGITKYVKGKYKEFLTDLEREKQIKKAQKEAEYKARLGSVDKLAQEKAKIKREAIVKRYKEKVSGSTFNKITSAIREEDYRPKSRTIRISKKPKSRKKFKSKRRTRYNILSGGFE